MPTKLGLILSIVSVSILWYQISQTNEFKKFDNFKYFNKVYDDWYNDMPEKISNNEKTHFCNLTGDGKAWVRRYFNLYAHEYYFSEKGMLPKEMWQNLIHGCDDEKNLNAAFRNMKKYPALLEGYFSWREEGSFSFPHGFADMLKSELQRCKVRYNTSQTNKCRGCERD